MNREKFDQQYNTFIEASAVDGRFSQIERQAVLNEDTVGLDDFGYTYMMHTCWAAKVLSETRPSKHIDIGSYSFFAPLVSAFVPTEFYDIRTPNIPMPWLKVGQADLTRLPFPDNSVESISCLHSLEHVGLGRYGDQLDVQGDIKSANELKRVLAPKGQLLMVLPLKSRARVVFNAHRFYSFESALNLFKGLEVAEYSLVMNDRTILRNANPFLMDDGDTQTDGTSMFRFVKP